MYTVSALNNPIIYDYNEMFGVFSLNPAPSNNIDVWSDIDGYTSNAFS